MARTTALVTMLVASAALMSQSYASPVPTSSSLLVLPSLALPSLPPCATYHGRIGTTLSGLHSIIYLPAGCSIDGTASRVIPFEWDNGRLTWVTDSAIDTSVELMDRKYNLAMARVARGGGEASQMRLGGDRGEVGVRNVLRLPGGMGKLVQFSTDDDLSNWTMDEDHSYFELVSISVDPLPLPASDASLEGTSGLGSAVDKASVKRVTDHLHKLRFSPLISKMLTSLPREQFKKDVRYLSGEDQRGANASQSWHSRHSMSEGGTRASFWLLAEFRSFGLECEHHYYLPHFAPMITCEIQGTDPKAGTFVLGGHFDSRGTFGSLVAPGADDDGSGTSLLLSIARHVSSHHISFKRKVIIAAFSGEEQGLLGSNYFAKKLKADGEDVALMVQADMVGYRKPGEPMQLAFPDLIGLPEARYLMGNISEIYVPELVVGLTPACCSDHQSFEQQGFASTWVFERNGPIADPKYHNSGDVSDRAGYDFEQIYLATRVVLATLLEVAGFSFA